jgi:hypothetical protein
MKLLNTQFSPVPSYVLPSQIRISPSAPHSQTLSASRLPITSMTGHFSHIYRRREKLKFVYFIIRNNTNHIGLSILHGYWYLHRFFCRSTFLLPLAMNSYSNFGTRVSLILNKCCVHLHLQCTVVWFELCTFSSAAVYPCYGRMTCILQVIPEISSRLSQFSFTAITLCHFNSVFLLLV